MERKAILWLSFLISNVQRALGVMYSTSSSPQLPPKQQTFIRQYRVLELVCSHISILIRSFGGAQPISEQDREIHNKERIEIELVHKMMPPAWSKTHIYWLTSTPLSGNLTQTLWVNVQLNSYSLLYSQWERHHTVQSRVSILAVIQKSHTKSVFWQVCPLVATYLGKERPWRGNTSYKKWRKKGGRKEKWRMSER